MSLYYANVAIAKLTLAYAIQDALRLSSLPEDVILVQNPDHSVSFKLTVEDQVEQEGETS